MLVAFTCMLITAILAAGAYYAAFRWVKLEHNRDTIADELKRALDHITDLEARIDMMEAQHDLQKVKAHPEGDNNGWSAFDLRQQ